MRHGVNRLVGLLSSKLDMSKTFNRAEWMFFATTLWGLGFYSSFVDNVFLCVSNVPFSFSLKGSVWLALTQKKRIRQKDPCFYSYSSSEMFSCLLQDLQCVGRVIDIKVIFSSPPVSHLFFADDPILSDRAIPDKTWHLWYAIDLCGVVSG